MLEEIVQDRVTHVRASNQPIFRSDVDYDQLEIDRENAVDEWRKFGSEERKQYASQKDFESLRGVRNLKDPDLIPAKNLSILRNEAIERIN